jgi:hypothetical protein
VYEARGTDTLEGVLSRLRLLVVVLAVVTTACGGASARGIDAPSVPETTLATLVAQAGVSLDVLMPEDVPASAVFLAAVDQGLAGTVYEGDAFADPETYLGTAVLFCELLENGLSTEEVLTAYVLALTENAAGEEIPDVDLLLGGVILGAGVESLCPEYAGQLGAGS